MNNLLLPVIIVKSYEFSIIDLIKVISNCNINQIFMYNMTEFNLELPVIDNINIIIKKSVNNNMFLYRNEVLNMVKEYNYKYFLFMDQDNFIYENSLKDILHICDRDKDKDIFYYNIPIKNKDKSITYKPRLLKNSNIEYKELFIEYVDTSFIPSPLLESIFFVSNSEHHITLKNNVEDVIKICANMKKKSLRDYFYIAYSYYCIKDYESSINYFLSYIEKNNRCKNIELYYTYYYLGVMSKKQSLEKNKDKMFEYFIHAYKTYPNFEVLVNIILNLNKEDGDKNEEMIKNYYLEKLSTISYNITPLSDNLNMVDRLLAKYEYDKKNYIEAKKYMIKAYKREEDSNLLEFWDLIEDKIKINEIKEKKEIEYVTIALLVKDGSVFLPLFLKCLTLQTFPKYKTKLYIRSNNNKDDTIMILERWLDIYKDKYNEVYTDYRDLEENIEQYKQHEWNEVRFSSLAKIRQDSITWSKERNTHYFVVDCDTFIKEDTLEKLYEESKNYSVIAPLIIINPNEKNPFSNFHTVLEGNAKLIKDEKYIKLVNQELTGIHEVDVVHCCYFIRKDILDNVNYIEEKQSFEYLTFSKNLNIKGIKQWINNKELFGYLTFSSTENELEKETWLENFPNL